MVLIRLIECIKCSFTQLKYEKMCKRIISSRKPASLRAENHRTIMIFQNLGEKHVSSPDLPWLSSSI